MEKIHEILNYSVGNFTVGKILAAVVVFAVCYLLMRLIMRLLDRVLARVSIDATLRKVLKAVVKLVLYFVTAMIVIHPREFDILKSKKVPQSLEIGLFFCQIFVFNI